MRVLSAVPVAEIKARGSIGSADVLRLRRNSRDVGRITAPEAEIVLALNDACPAQDPAWADWFVETLTDFIVDQAEPEGYLTTDNAAWLIARIARDGRVETRTGIDLVLGVLGRARWVPPSLVCCALDQVREAVIRGSGPLRCCKPQAHGTVIEADVDLLRRILCSFDGDGHLPITRPEAEVLFAIDAGSADGGNHPCWGDLFVKALAQCVLAACGYATAPRKLALARTGRTAARAIGEARLTPHPPDRFQSGEEREIARLAGQRIEIITGERLALADAGWLAGRIAGEGGLSPNRRALLLALKAAGLALPFSLQALVDKAAAAP